MDLEEIENSNTKGAESKNPEEFVEFILGIYSTSSNVIIKKDKFSIEKCFKSFPGYWDKDIQKQALKEMLLNIINEKTLNNEQLNILNSKCVISKFLRPKETVILKYSLLDFIYNCYDFCRKDLGAEAEFVDKISNYINKE